MKSPRCSVGVAAVPLVVAVALAAGCGGAQAPEPASAGDGSGATGESKVCTDLSRALCTELGVQSDACLSARSVAALLSPRTCALAIDDFEHTRDRILALRGACEQLAKRVCDEMGEDSEACAGIRHDVPEIPPGHCEGLLADQDRLIAMLRERQAQSEPLSEEAWGSLLAGQPPGFGAADAKVQVVEFSDFQCPYCAEAANTVHKLREQYSGRIRFVFRNYPLPFHPDARAAAQASIAAHQQGKFWEFHDRLFANQDALGSDELLEHAKAAGLDVEAFRSAANGEVCGTKVEEDLRLGEQVHVRGTPTMFVNRKRVENPLDYEAVSAQVEAALGQQQPSGS